MAAFSAHTAVLIDQSQLRQRQRNTRKTERGAKPFLTDLAVRAAPFALVRRFIVASTPLLDAKFNAMTNGLSA
jgi:hypothetical protein